MFKLLYLDFFVISMKWRFLNKNIHHVLFIFATSINIFFVNIVSHVLIDNIKNQQYRLEAEKVIFFNVLYQSKQKKCPLRRL